MKILWKLMTNEAQKIEQKTIDKRPHTEYHYGMTNTKHVCESPDSCNFTEDFGLCAICENRLVESIQRSIDNMGTPDRLCCGVCGVWYDGCKDFLDHPCVKNANS